MSSKHYIYDANPNSREREVKRRQICDALENRDDWNTYPYSLFASADKNRDLSPPRSPDYNPCGNWMHRIMQTDSMIESFHTFTGRESYFREKNFSPCELTVYEIQDWIENDKLISQGHEDLICEVIKYKVKFIEAPGSAVDWC